MVSIGNIREPNHGDRRNYSRCSGGGAVYLISLNSPDLTDWPDPYLPQQTGFALRVQRFAGSAESSCMPARLEKQS